MVLALKTHILNSQPWVYLNILLSEPTHGQQLSIVKEKGQIILPIGRPQVSRGGLRGSLTTTWWSLPPAPPVHVHLLFQSFIPLSKLPSCAQLSHDLAFSSVKKRPSLSVSLKMQPFSLPVHLCQLPFSLLSPTPYRQRLPPLQRQHPSPRPHCGPNHFQAWTIFYLLSCMFLCFCSSEKNLFKCPLYKHVPKSPSVCTIHTRSAAALSHSHLTHLLAPSHSPSACLWH